MLPLIPIAIGLGVLAAGVAGPLLRQLAERDRAAAAKARARVTHQRLGHGVETIDPGANAIAQTELARAAERWQTTGALLEEAGTFEECVDAERAAEEGLHHLVKACRALGIEPPPYEVAD